MSRDRAPDWLLPVLLPALAAAIAFAGTLRNGLVYDDPIVLTWLDSRSWSWRGFFLETRALTYATHALDRALWGSWTPGLHLTNVLLHALASAFTGLVALRLTRSRLVGCACGLLFAVHPVHVESVASIANRKDVLAMIFVLAGFLAWTRCRRDRVRLPLTTLCYVCALASKEVAAAGLPLALLGHDVLLDRRPARGSLLRLSPLFALGLVAAVVFASQGPAPFGEESIERSSYGHYRTWSESASASLANLPDVFRLLFFPLRLAVDYPVRPATGLGGRALLGIALAAAWILGAVAIGRTSRPAAFAMTWTLLMYLPASNLVPLHHIPLAERYLYVPSFGVCLLFGLAVESALPRSAAVLAPAGLVVIAATARSMVRVTDWRSVETLAEACDRDGIDTWRAHTLAGAAAVRAKDHAEAFRRYTRAVELRPHDPALQFARALSAAAIGDHRAAAESCRRAVELKPGHVMAHYTLGLSLVRTGDLPGGVAAFRDAVRLDDRHAEIHYDLGGALLLSGDHAGAAEAFRRCVALEPERAEAHVYLGILLAEQGDQAGALSEYQRALDLEPRNTRLLERIAVACEAQGRYDWAERAYRRLVRLEPADAGHARDLERVREKARSTR